MNVSRRFFIGGATSFGALVGCRAMAGTLAGSGTPRLTFGVLSDIHIRNAAKPGDAAISSSYNDLSFVHALEWFRDNGVDGVVVAGDMADRGLIRELEVVAAAWQRVFPNDRAPDGRKVERLFVYGNHDMGGRYNDKTAPRFIYPNPKAAWESVFHEPFEKIWTKSVRGYRFVGAHWWDSHGCNGHDERFNVAIPDWYAAHAKEIDPSLPFFHIQHPHPLNTCYGEWAWGRDDGLSTKALSAFSNAVAFSGHSHYSLTDERAIWQGAFTSVGTASLRFGAIEDNEYRETGFENTISRGRNHHVYDAAKLTPQIQIRVDESDVRQGMLWKVYGDCMTVRRHEFITDLDLGADWTIPLPCAESRPYAFAEHAKKIGAPAFSAGAALAVSRVTGKTRGAKKGKKANRPEIAPVEKPAVKIVIPAAVAKDGARVYQFEIAVSGKSGGEKIVRRVIAAGFNRGLAHPRVKEPTVCLLPLDVLPKGELVIEVTPLNCYARRGASLRSEV